MAPPAKQAGKERQMEKWRVDQESDALKIIVLVSVLFVTVVAGFLFFGPYGPFLLFAPAG